MRDDSLWIAQVFAFSYEYPMSASARALMGVASAAGVDSSHSMRVCKLVDLASSEISNLMDFTGSGGFNRIMRKWAMQQGYKLNEYGLWKRIGEGKITKDTKFSFSS